jgi:hypothetical protein
MYLTQIDGKDVRRFRRRVMKMCGGNGIKTPRIFPKPWQHFQVSDTLHAPYPLTPRKLLSSRFVYEAKLSSGAGWNSFLV